MPHVPRITTEVPNVENTVPIALYQVSSPERFSLDDDKFVLYGGGDGFLAQLSANDPTHTLVVAPELDFDWSHLALYVLNTSLVVWSVNTNVGLELPYQNILLHALKDTSQGPLLYLQVLSSAVAQAVPSQSSEFAPTVVLEISQRGSSESLSPLFAHVDATVLAVYHALSQCSALHYDTDDVEEPAQFHEEPALDIPASWVQETVLDTTGNADDLEEIPVADPEDEAAMHVDVGYASIVGSIRKREHDSNGTPKSRRLV
ncbi:uncharacterized protein CANTADRAFT_171115 [Suhomyces tanzawaensis NRRL Y-17324]|uniref:Protein LOT5 n=1 Tax=Suhomyces tanzawaensis NRRL Y-17324 TaxID=984487 RepID=A0A1E4SMM6_9ASCO|nr:uncharacterized protein CANTADRAFT_171115 [Suhomyces tanzawaensis NRRL Y-17324]ODV80771.1 hypothetical protein CANTADRAFT_171115 [Suhomyces tanzawaensis NRRL Y-17324]